MPLQSLLFTIWRQNSVGMGREYAEEIFRDYSRNGTALTKAVCIALLPCAPTPRRLPTHVGEGEGHARTPSVQLHATCAILGL